MNTTGELFVSSVKILTEYFLTQYQEVAKYTQICATEGHELFFSPRLIYKYNMPQISGKLNYINLSSLKIYTISVTTSIVDSYQNANTALFTNSNVADNTFVFTDTKNFKNNPYYSLDDTLYVSGGVSTTSGGVMNYIGDAKMEDLSADDLVYYVPGYQKTQSFNRKVSHIVNTNELYEKDPEGTINYSTYGDALFVENTIILWGGLRTYYKRNGATNIVENAYSRTMLSNTTETVQTVGAITNSNPAKFNDALYKDAGAIKNIQA